MSTASRSASEVLAILQESGPEKLAGVELEGEGGVDLRGWEEVLATLEATLCELSTKITTTSSAVATSSTHSRDDAAAETAGTGSNDAKAGVCCILSFLCRLLKGAKEKRGFQAYKCLSTLLHAVDTQIVELAIETLFHACSPGFSSRSGVDDIDTKESIDVPLPVAQDVLIIFEGLGILSSNYGLLDYLRGHEPSGVRPGVTRLALNYPGAGAGSGGGTSSSSSSSSSSNNSGGRAGSSSDAPSEESKYDPETVSCDLSLESAGDVLLPGSAKDDLKVLQRITSCLPISGDGSSISGGGEGMELESKTESIADSQKKRGKRVLSLLSITRAMAGLQGSPSQRARIALLRLRCAFVLSHSRVEADRVGPYLCSWSVFFKDCLALADYSSEAIAELRLDDPITVSTVALECVASLLDCCVRRRGNSLSHVERAGILRELGISSDGLPDMSPSQEPVWTCVVLSACSLSTLLFEERSTTTSQPSLSSTVPADVHALRKAVNIGCYVRMGLELFSMCLSARENNPTNNYSSFDAGAVNAVIGLIHASLPAMSAILSEADKARLASSKPSQLQILSSWDNEVILTISKALTGLSRCFEVPQYQHAVRDNDGLAPVISIIEAFVSTRSDTELVLDDASRGVLETAFEIIAAGLDMNRRSAHGTNASAAQIIHQPCFQKVCKLVFSLPFRGNELLWTHLMKVVRGAINAEPSFLGHFLRSEYIQSLVGALDVSATLESNPRSLVLSPKLLDKTLVILAKLVVSMCITSDGQGFLVDHRLPKFLIDIFAHSAVLMPTSEGLSGETSHKVAKCLSLLMRDCPAAVEDMRSAMQRSLKGACDECLQAWTTPSAGLDAVAMSSLRMQALQRLGNICSLVESVCSSDQKRNSTGAETIKELLTEDVVLQLVAAFSCTLPPPRQLLAQLGVRHNGTFLFCGYHPTAAKLTSLFKSASSHIPHVILPVLFRSVDETLSAVSAAKSALRAFSVQQSFDNTSGSQLGHVSTSSYEKPPDEDEDGPVDRGARRRERRSRGASLGGEGANVLILGVLDYLPHRCVFDLPANEERSKELEIFTWKFLTPILILEWLGQIMSFCLRPIQRAPPIGMSYLTNGKDVVRRLFAFHRSSLLEVCRFAASKWTPKSIQSSEVTKRTMLHSFANCDSSEDIVPISRIPRVFVLRIVSSAGALIREDCEIEGSRVIQHASFGTIHTAYERSHTNAGVVRYRTELGWLSEYRRDHHREPIVEIIDILNGDAADAKIAEEFAKNRELSPHHARAVESLTIRESATYAMTRVHSALRLAGMHLSRATFTEGGPDGRLSRGTGRPLALSPSAPVIVNSLSKSIKGFFVQSMECLEEASIPPTLPLSIMTTGLGTSTSSASSSSRGTPVPSIKDWMGMGDDSTPVKAASGSGSFDKTSRRSSKKDNKNERRTLSRNNSRDFTNYGETDENKESVHINGAAMSLYLGAVVKYFVVPMLDDRYGNLNTYLIRTMSSFGCMEAIMEAFAFIVATLTNALNESTIENKINGKVALSSAGLCALHSLPSVISMLRRLVQKDSLTRAIGGVDMANRGPNPITAAIANLDDELGKFQLHELLYNILNAIATKALPFFRSKTLVLMPINVQTEWYQFVGELIQSLRTPLPVPSAGNDGPGSLVYNPFRPPSAPAESGSRDMLNYDAFIRRSDARATILRQMTDAINPPAVAAPASPSAPTSVAADAASELNSPVFESTPLGAALSPPAPPASQDTASMLASAINNISAIVRDSSALTSDSQNNLQQAMFDEELLAEAGGDPELLLALQLSTEGMQRSPRNDDALSPISPIAFAASSPSEAGSVEDALGDQLDAGMLRLSSAPSAAQAAAQNRRRAGSGTQNPREAVLQGFSLNDLPREASDTAAPASSGRGTDLVRTNSTPKSDKKPPLRPQSASSRASSLSDDLTSKSASLEALAALFDGTIIESILDTCMLKTDTNAHSPQGLPSLVRDDEEASVLEPTIFQYRTIAPQMCKFLIQWNDSVAHNSAGGSGGDAKWSATLLSLLAKQISKPRETGVGDKGLFGCMHLMLCCLRSSIVRSKISHVLDRSFAHLLLASVADRIEAEVDAGTIGGLDTPIWLSPAFLVLFQLLCSESRKPDSAPDAGAGTAASKGSSKSPSKATADGESKDNSNGKESATSASSSSNGLTPEQMVMRDLSSSLFDDFLVDPAQWLRVYSLVDKVIAAFDAKKDESPSVAVPLPTKMMTIEVISSLLLLLSVLVARQELCDTFVHSGTLAKVLTLPSSLSAEDGAMSGTLAIIVQRCVETPIELRVNMSMAFRTFWKNSTRQPTLKAKKGVPLSEFLEFAETSGFMKRSPEDFSAALYNTMAIVSEDNSKGDIGKSEKEKEKDKAPQIIICLLQKKVHEERYRHDKLSLLQRGTDLDDRAVRTIRILVSQIQYIISQSPEARPEATAKDSVKSQRANKDVFLYTISQTVHALSDCILSLRRLPRLMSKGAFAVALSSAAVPGPEAPIPISVPEYLITSVFQDDEGLPGSAIQASTRLLVVLCASKGACRKAVLNALLHCLTRRVDSTIPNDKAERTKHVRHIARIARLFAIVVSAAFHVQQPYSQRPDRQQVISVEAIQYLITADVQNLLTRTLASIPIDDELAVDALDAVCEPLELMTRPKLVTHLTALIALEEKSSSQVTTDSLSNTQTRTALYDASEQLLTYEPQGPRESFDQAGLDAFWEGVTIDGMRQRAEDNEEPQEVLDGQEGEEQEGDEEDDDVEDAEEEDDGEEDDEDEDEEGEGEGDEGEDDGEGNEWNEGEDDDDGDNGDDDDGRGGDGMLVPQADINGPIFGSFPFAAGDGNGSVQDMVSDLMRSVIFGGNERNGMSLNDPGNNLFVTPPDQIRRDPLNSLLSRLSPSDLDGDSAAEALIVNLLRQSGPTDEVSTAFNTLRSGSARRSELTSQMLPQGVGNALFVQRPRQTHPLLAYGEFAVEPSSLGDVLTETQLPHERANSNAQTMPDPFSSLRRYGVGIDVSVDVRSTADEVHLSTSIAVPDNQGGVRYIPASIRSRLIGQPEPSLSSHLFAPSTLNREGAAVGAAVPTASRRANFLSRLVSSVASHSLQHYDTTTMESLPHASLNALALATPSEPAVSSTSAGSNSSANTATGASTTTLPLDSPVTPDETFATAEAPPVAAAVQGELIVHETPVPAPVPETPTAAVVEAPAESDQVPSLDASTDSSVGTLDSPPSSAADIPMSSSPTRGAPPARTEEESSGSAALGREEAEEDELQTALFARDVAPALVPADDLTDEAILSNLSAGAPAVDAAPASEPSSSDSASSAGGAPARTGPACPAGYDPDVFYSLPDFMQAEILEQHVATNEPSNVRELAEAAGFDYDTFLCLPESIRQELLDQARRDQAAAQAASSRDTSSANVQDMDNASFLASLADPALRAEVLLTADPSFLATLPPELMAEASMHRERIAASWQQREMQRRPARAANAPVIEAQRRAMNILGGGEDDDTESDEETSGHRARSRRGQAQLTAPIGTMLVPSDDQDSTLVPPELLVVLSKIILNASLRVNTTLVQRLLLNISKFPPYRDVGLRLCMAMMTQRQDVVDACVQQLTQSSREDGAKSASDAPSTALTTSQVDSYTSWGSSLQLSLSAPVVTPASFTSHPNAPSLQTKQKEADANSDNGGSTEREAEDGERVMLPAVVRRLAITVAQLVTHNESISFDLLRPRVEASGKATSLLDFVVPEPPEAKSEGKTEAGAGATDEAAVSENGKSIPVDAKDGGIDEGVKEAPISLPSLTLVQAGPSTHSLLEDFFAPLSIEAVLADASALVALTNLIALITGPLERLVPEQDNEADSAAPAALVARTDARYRALRVPAVNVVPTALRSLCGVLLSETCTKEVFENIVVAISRLAKMRLNRSVILAALTEVTQDLAGQSYEKLVGLGEALTLLAGQLQAQASPTSSAGGSSSPRQRSGVNQLPLGQISGRSHDRFFRAVQTLQTVSLKTRRALIDVIPLDATAPLWSSLDDVLLQLRRYVIEETEEKSGNVKAQVALVSFITRLLSVIEAFFLIFTSELLSEGEAAIANAANASAASTSVSATPSATGGSSATPASIGNTATTAASPAAVASTSIMSTATSRDPGEKYHRLSAYQRMNLPLAPEGGDDSLSGPAAGLARATNLQRSSSLARQLSNSVISAGANAYANANANANAGISLQAARHQRAQLLLSFVQAHKGVLNLLIASRPALLEGSLQALIRVPLLRSTLVFENKRKYFFAQLKAQRFDRSRRIGGLHLQLRRDQVFEDSFNQLRMRSAEEMRGRLQINFRGEEGVDAGGLTREWYVVLSREIFNPNYALFTSADGSTFQPWSQSMINSNHLDYFRFVGRVIGKAICDQQLMDAHFTRSFYKHVIGMKVDYSDIEATEPDYYKSLKQILEFSLEDIGVELTFSAETNTFGKVEVVDLVPGGRRIAVTDDNKHEYVQLVAKHRMTTAIRAQIDSFLDGFYDLVPPELITIFSPTELELLICGLPDVDVEDLCANTEYHNFQPADQAIQYFWEVLRGFSREERALFLQFVTGTSKVPLDGFASLQGMRGLQRFSIHRAYNTALLPTAHTCFNQLDLASYKSLEEMREKLLIAIQNSSEGFGFA